MERRPESGDRGNDLDEIVRPVGSCVTRDVFTIDDNPNERMYRLRGRLNIGVTDCGIVHMFFTISLLVPCVFRIVFDV